MPGRALADRLREREPARALLAELGAPEPERASAALCEAAAHPDLAAGVEAWAEPLLLSARPGFAAQCLVQLADRYRGSCAEPLPLAAAPQLPALLGNSDFLARLLLRHPHWADQLRGAPPEPPSETKPEADWTAIRIAKYQGLLRIAAREQGGIPIEDSLQRLSALADGCLRSALERACEEEGSPTPALFGLGKLGGRELNFSSDVDLLFLHDPDPDQDPAQEKLRLTRVIQRFKRHLEVRSEDGFAYRVDLSLRPEGRSGALINSVDAAFHYYEGFGADWERQMLIRLRHIGGAERAAHGFTAGIEPFVFRRGIDPDAIRGVREMKARIELERRQAGLDLEADLKEGPGGIRDAEFFVQALQLLHGGRESALRTPSMLRSFEVLGELEIVPPATLSALREGYLWLRRAEHCAQLIEERQTHQFPREPSAQLGLARRMGYADWSGTTARARLLDDWVRVRTEVRHHFQALVLGSQGE